MPKVSAKNGIVLIGGYNFSTYATAYDGKHDTGLIDVTGFSDGGKNYIPGMPAAEMTVAMLWDATATVGVHAVLSAFPTGVVTILPEGYALGNNTISMPYMQGNYAPSGKPDGAIQAGSIKFSAYGTNVGIENGYALQHGTITNTLTGTGFDDPTSAAVTAACGASLHIWQACAADTYVVKVQHSTTLGSGYADLITFTANGSALTSERQVVASGTVNRYRRIVATRTGSAGNTFGFTVSFWHA